MAGTLEPSALPAPLRPQWWRRGMPQTQTAYVAAAFAALIVVIWMLAPVLLPTPGRLMECVVSMVSCDPLGWAWVMLGAN